MVLDITNMPFIVLTLDDIAIKNGVTWLNSWLPLSILAIMASLLLHGAFLMVARAFSIKEFENYAKSEMLQAFSTFFMAVFLVTMVSSAMDIAKDTIAGEVACGATPILIGSTSESTMDEAFTAIQCRLQQRAIAVRNVQNQVTEEGTAVFNGLNWQMSIFGITFFKGDWVSSWYKESETKRITNNLATVLLIGLNAQGSLIAYLKANMLSMFLPLGVLLRSFYFSRSVGALFIAFGIGMYFIFPIFFVLLDPAYSPAPPAPPAPPQQQSPYCYATMSTTTSIVKTLNAGGLGTTGKMSNANVRDELSKSYIQLMIHPVVAFFLTLVFIRYMMTLLGADTYEVMRMASKVI